MAHTTYVAYICGTCHTCCIFPNGYVFLHTYAAHATHVASLYMNMQHMPHMLHTYAAHASHDAYGVATISRMLKNIGLCCKRDLQKRPIFCKETYIFKHPTHRSHPISSNGYVFEHEHAAHASHLLTFHACTANISYHFPPKIHTISEYFTEIDPHYMHVRHTPHTPQYRMEKTHKLAEHIVSFPVKKPYN